MGENKEELISKFHLTDGERQKCEVWTRKLP